MASCTALLKGADKDEMLVTIRAAAAGEARFGPVIARRLTEFFQRASDQDLAGDSVRRADRP